MVELTRDIAAASGRSTHFDVPSYELEELSHLQPAHPENFNDDTPGREFSLPPVDEGKDAWLCLVGGFFLEVMVWGMLSTNYLLIGF